MVKTDITERWKENVNYELIPKEDDSWQIRILTGDYEQCVISYSKISINEDNQTIKFDYTLDYTPVPGVTSEDLELQRTASHILHSVLMGLLENENSNNGTTR